MFFINCLRRLLSQQSECQHYKRNCDKKAPCCGKYYPCRLCHDQNYNPLSKNNDDCKIEIMDRFKVTEIRCRKCGTEQKVSNQCTNCQIQFAQYFCEICKLYDDDPTKQIYHCRKCQMCRRGKQEDNFHCDTCGICLLKSTQQNHKCLKNICEDQCSVCLENIKISTKFICQLPNCAHYMHIECQTQLLKANKRNCPTCSFPIHKMTTDEIEQYDKFAQETLKLLSDTQKQLKLSIFCMDCRKTSENIQFNYYLKCAQCGSYNTKK